MTHLFSPKLPPQLAPPAPTPPAPMPDTNSAAVLEAQRKAASDIVSRAGRTSTILTAPTQRGSGAANYDTFGSAKLGGS